MLRIFVCLALLSPTAFAGTVDCQVKDAAGKIGTATFTIHGQSEEAFPGQVESAFIFDGQEIPVLRTPCANRNGAKLCVHSDGAGNRYDFFVTVDGPDSVQLGAIHWSENQLYRLKVRQNCDSRSDWE